MGELGGLVVEIVIECVNNLIKLISSITQFSVFAISFGFLYVYRILLECPFMFNLSKIILLKGGNVRRPISVLYYLCRCSP